MLYPVTVGDADGYQLRSIVVEFTTTGVCCTGGVNVVVVADAGL